MKLVSDLYNKAASFKKDENGSILPLTAILLTTLALAGGAAVDYSRYSSAKNVMNTALDAAILDAGVRLGSGQPVDQKFEDDFNAFFNANIAGRGGFADDFRIVNFSADEETGRVNASAAATLDTTLMRIGGIDTLNVSSTSGGIFAQNDTEVTIMLDVTGSMDRTVTGTGIRKIDSLKNAAKEAVAALLPNGNQTANTRVGIVPYASSVNASSFAATVTAGNEINVAAAGTFTNAGFNVPTTACVTGRGGRDAATDTFYADNAPLGSDSRSINGGRFFGQRRACPEAEIMPLTNDRSALESEIDSLVARNNGFTAGHLGVAWSYYMLSPKWTPLWNTASDPAPFSSDVNKFAILMTDGEFNTAYDGVNVDNRDLAGTENILPFGHVLNIRGNVIRDQRDRSTNRSETVTDELCRNMRNDGIIVYTIAFDAPTSAETLLRGCASTNSNGQSLFFSAANGQELNDAFNEIVDDITRLRLTN